ncbi:MAG: SPOR domain-containing protein [Pseudotabrizicola sp.]|uniref:SPOR domain-containing protein n=1 Tax=Pseudotabrizicola sp. TaxID=2939647 RepID=UPI0027223DD3|nr:SPOR domain-containing protein [Pseudotabrizicola sp.]MDO9637697.1 SPOR domain-containing protein [Pseudotabrizicola sp.]
MTVASTALAACVDGANPFRGAAKEGGATASTSTRLVDRDVEAPEVFQTKDKALWDGRPSLGGVWVASPDAKDPERVIIRNTANGKFVIGALFRREIENPGPKLQISSDAAAALGMLAGAPADVSVIALRREETPVTPDANKPILDSSETVETRSLDPVAGAAAAIARAEDAPVAPTPAAPVVRAAAPAPAAAAAAPATGGRTIQIGIFSVEANATRAAASLSQAGLQGTVRREESKGKPLWSVTTSGDAAALTRVKGAGFPDAYFLNR